MPDEPCQPPDFGPQPVPASALPARLEVESERLPRRSGTEAPEDFDTRHLWSTMGVTAQNYIISTYLSPRFRTLKDLCDFHHLCYDSVQQALSRRNLEEQRADSERQHKRTTEQNTRDAINELVARVRAGVSTLDIIDTRIRHALLTERISMKTLKELRSRVTADNVREIIVLRGLIEAQESQMVPEISTMEVSQQADTVIGTSSAPSSLGESGQQKFMAELRRMAVKLTFRQDDSSEEDEGSDGNGQHPS